MQNNNNFNPETGKYEYDFPMVSITVDCVIFRYNEISNSPEVLLIKRKNEPFKDCWALPGGFVDPNETIIEATYREVLEETSVDIKNKSCFKYVAEKIYDTPNRDPRGRTISMMSIAVIPNSTKVEARDDASEYKWFNINNLPSLAFDHREMVEYSKKKVF